MYCNKNDKLNPSFFIYYNITYTFYLYIKLYYIYYPNLKLG